VLNTSKSTIKWPFLAAFGLFWGLSGCGQSTVKTHPLPQPLPTQMVFKRSVFKVQKAISELFNSYPLVVFQTSPLNPPHFTLFWKGKKHPDEIKIFKNPVNENDVYISCNREPVCRSSVYTDWRGRDLEYMADFQLHLIPQGAKETLVRVIVIDPEVIAGKRFGFGSCGPGMANAYEKVEPTTVEENELLTALQKKFRQK